MYILTCLSIYLSLSLYIYIYIYIYILKVMPGRKEDDFTKIVDAICPNFTNVGPSSNNSCLVHLPSSALSSMKPPAC